MPAPVELFKSVYRRLNRDTLGLIDDLYDEQVVFQDPVRAIHGREALRGYLAGMYRNVRRCEFEFNHEFVNYGAADAAMLTWLMTLEHPRIAGGRPVEVHGASMIKFADKVLYHRDYFDLGAMLYEHVPILGGVIRFIKHRI